MAVFQTKPMFRYLDLRPSLGLGYLHRAANIDRAGKHNTGDFVWLVGCISRLCLLANKIPFDEELVTFQDWEATEKAKCSKEDNPAGMLPDLVVGDKKYAEHVAICRYLARKTGEYGKDIEVDAVADMAAGAHVDWRNAFVAGSFGTEDDAEKYRQARSMHYRAMEWYYAMKPSPCSPYLSDGEVPGFADCLIVNLLWDDTLKYTPVDLSAYPNVKAMHDAASSNPELSAWRAQLAAQVKAMAA